MVLKINTFCTCIVHNMDKKKKQRCHYELEPCSESHTVDIKACDDSMIAKVYMTTESSPRASLQCVHSPNT